MKSTHQKNFRIFHFSQSLSDVFSNSDLQVSKKFFNSIISFTLLHSFSQFFCRKFSSRNFFIAPEKTKKSQKSNFLYKQDFWSSQHQKNFRNFPTGIFSSSFSSFSLAEHFWLRQKTFHLRIETLCDHNFIFGLKNISTSSVFLFKSFSKTHPTTARDTNDLKNENIEANTRENIFFSFSLRLALSGERSVLQENHKFKETAKENCERDRVEKFARKFPSVDYCTKFMQWEPVRAENCNRRFLFVWKKSR